MADSSAFRVERHVGHDAFHTLFSASPHALLLADDNFLVTEANPAAQALLGTREGVVGHEGRNVLQGSNLIALHDVRDLLRAESRLLEQRQVLSRISRRGDSGDPLADICSSIESELPGVLCSIHLYDSDARILRAGAAPSLPAPFWLALRQVPVSSQMNPFGAAVLRKDAVVTPDISTDELWSAQAGLRDLALANGLRSCWAIPILDGTGSVVGTFGLYTREARRPGPDERWVIELCASLASLVIGLQSHADATLRRDRSFVSNVLQSVGNLVMVVDLEGRVVRFNRACQTLSGYSDDELRGRALWEVLVPPEDVTPLRGFFEVARDGTFPVESESTWLTRSGERRLVAWVNAPLNQKDGSVKYLVQTGADITDRRRAEDALRESEERYRMLFERNLAGVYHCLTNGHLLDCNDAFAQTFGYESREGLLAAGPTPPFHVDPAERDEQLERLKELRFLANLEFRARRRDGREIWVLENESYVEERNGAPPTLLGTLIDITDRKRAEEELERQAFHDALTGLPNRRLFDDRIEVALASARYHRQTVAVLFLDLDRFKVVNDSLGHKAGDTLLQLAAQRLRETVYEGDTVARRGGDEFLVLLPRLRSPEHVGGVARKILQRFREPFSLEGHEVFVTLSIGISLYPLDGEDGGALIENADTAMYRAKSLGRDSYQIYLPAMNEHAADQMALASDLHGALRLGELFVHYQPIVEVATSRVAATEALVRWQHPRRGLLQPGQFVPLAEETGLIGAVGGWVLDHACRATRSLQTRGFPDLRVAVNLSARQFANPSLPAEIHRLLVLTGLPPHALDLEITESIAMAGVEESLGTLRALKDLGVQLSLDDFGTGYSSLSYLKRFPIDSLKIDRSFIQDVTTNERDFAIAVATIAIAHGLKLQVIAEGVETDEQREFLRQQGCDFYQGFVFSKPLSIDELGRLLQAGSVS